MGNAKTAALDRIRQDILEHNICPELAATATNLVMGGGSVDADIVFIGEAPGKNEDEQGLPFVGAAGRFLNVMLESVNLERADVYITNIVKYRPPNNRDPKPEEKAAFWPFLVRQLNVIGPSIVVTLGRHSMEYFLPGQKISAVHGEPKQVRFGESTIVVVPLFHPAAALYNPNQRQTLLDDFSRIPNIVERIKNSEKDK